MSRNLARQYLWDARLAISLSDAGGVSFSFPTCAFSRRMSSLSALKTGRLSSSLYKSIASRSRLSSSAVSSLPVVCKRDSAWVA